VAAAGRPAIRGSAATPVSLVTFELVQLDGPVLNGRPLINDPLVVGAEALRLGSVRGLKRRPAPLVPPLATTQQCPARTARLKTDEI
jgi:hypothetical protein